MTRLSVRFPSPSALPVAPSVLRRSGGWKGVWSLLLLLAAVGCEGEDPLGEAVLGELQGLPIPASAELAARDAGTAQAPILVYRVPGATYEQVKAWYDREMPLGNDWQGWAWCDSEETTAGFFRYYHRPDEALLSLIVTPDVGILLSYTTAGRC